ncbi:hypothetical protein BV898_14141 [Hypsibius exemplaris]|uniref:Uncharacterized protein n=1 Tax=Hypsibius exemplaris TaxID=2072580 RepID=A0A1W0W8N5_HYPEX|nr:hypothetical protein BV898_14141 [Hypsibius exemplaris]
MFCVLAIFLLCAFAEINALPKKALQGNPSLHAVNQGQRINHLLGKKQLNPHQNKLAARIASVTGTATPGTITKTTLAGATKLPTQKPFR